MIDLPRLLLVTDQHRERPGALEAAVAAGAKFVQIRDKDLDDDAVLMRLASIREASALACSHSADQLLASELADRGRSGLQGPAAPLVCINGRPRLAKAEGVGLHLPAVHATVSRDGISPLGRSAHDEDEVARAVAEGVDYLIVGTVFETASKPGRRPLGLEGLARLTALAAPLPVYAIGGMTPARVAAVLDTGAHGVAVCSAVLAATDVAAATQSFLSRL